MSASATTTGTMRAFVIETLHDDCTDETGDKTVGRLKSDEPVPLPGDGEALVRVLRAGVCNTDLELLAGYMGFTGIVGHEFVGVVEKVNTSDKERSRQHVSSSDLVGKRVVGEINVACTACHVCEAGGDGARNHCPKRTVLGIMGKHGTYAEYLTLPCRNLHVVPVNVSDAAAVFAEPLAAACRIVEQGLAPPEADAAILGDGKLGLLIAEVLARRESDSTDDLLMSTDSVPEETGYARRRGSTTIIGRHRENMDLCCGPAEEGGDGSEDQQLIRVDGRDASAVKAMAGAYDVVVDATGSPQGLAAASELCRPMGTVVLKSTCAAGAGFNPAPVVINEQRVVGSRCGPFEAALELLSSTSGDAIKVEQYISGVFSLDDTSAALEAARKKGALKVQIICSSSDGSTA